MSPGSRPGPGVPELARWAPEEAAVQSPSSGGSTTHNVSSDEDEVESIDDVEPAPTREGSCKGLYKLKRAQSATISMPHYRTYELWSLGAVVVSVMFTVVESLPQFQDLQERHQEINDVLIVVHGVLGAYFLFDYIWRLRCDGLNYAFSFFGAVDFFSAAAIIPDILDIVWKPWKSEPVFAQGNVGSLLRAARLLRAFRVMKLSRFQDELVRIRHALSAERYAILVFFMTIMIALLFLGSALHVVEGGTTANSHTDGFDSIPDALWWAIVTLTTVGYGDVVPQTFLGRLIACIIMLLGYSVLAVPTITSVLGQNDPLMTLLQAKPGVPEERTELPRSQGFGPLLAEDEADLPDQMGAHDSLRQYPFVVHLPTRPGDADEYGFLQSNTFSLLVEAAVSSLLAAAAPPADPAVVRPRPFAAKSACSVLEPVALPESLDAGVVVEELGASTCKFAVGLFARSSGRLCALGHLHHTWVDALSRRPASMPSEVRFACSAAMRRGSPQSPQA